MRRAESERTNGIIHSHQNGNQDPSHRHQTTGGQFQFSRVWLSGKERKGKIPPLALDMGRNPDRRATKTKKRKARQRSCETKVTTKRKRRPLNSRQRQCWLGPGPTGLCFAWPGQERERLVESGVSVVWNQKQSGKEKLKWKGAHGGGINLDLWMVQQEFNDFDLVPLTGGFEWILIKKMR